MQSYCSEYGTVVASVDIINFPDAWVSLDSSKKWRNKEPFHDVCAITCCIDQSALCYRQQVEPVHGFIYVYEDDRYTVVDVTTHQKRYEFCKTRPNNVYCKNDPEGD